METSKMRISYIRTTSSYRKSFGVKLWIGVLNVI